MDALLEREDGFLSSENPDSDAALEDKKKRHRRKFAELERVYACPYRDCGRPYASEHSLQQHIRIKVLVQQGFGHRLVRLVCHVRLQNSKEQPESGTRLPATNISAVYCALETNRACNRRKGLCDYEVGRS